MSMLLVHELHEARDRILLLKQRLMDAKSQEIPAYQSYLDEQIISLESALEDARIPERYRVAVVGRFKVGKSSFINKLAGERLAGVDTTPETAAISVFRYDNHPKAEVELIGSEEWNRLREEHEANPKDPEVKRFDRFVNFNDRPSRDKDGKEQPRRPVDLDGLVKEWIKPGGFTHVIDSEAWSTKDAKKRFLAEVRRFTSGQEPLHYLVNKLTVYAPVPILRDSIEFVDTPGLDDTERFRVQLTEDEVKGVDAILFLTVSGASYSQSDKEFIVRQLRQKQIKHLQLIVTKCDETYENAVRDARENDDDPPSYEDFCKKEKTRVLKETSATLNELLDSNQLTDEEGYYYIRQLDNVPIHLISTKYHDEGEVERGGIAQVRDSLYTILSTSQRFEQSRAILVDRLDAALKKLQNSYRERLGAIERDYDPHKVRREIEVIRDALSEKLDFFAESAGGHVALLNKQQSAFFNTLPTHLDVICLLAKEVLSDLERDDLIKHWRKRRGGRWGYFSDLQAKVADRTFPQVEARLNELRSQMLEFMGFVSNSLNTLQIDMRAIEKEHRLSSLEPLDLAESQDPLFKDIETTFAKLTASERDGVIARLDEFVTEEAMTRLDAARQKVSDQVGAGTTIRQNREVMSFYSEIRNLMAQALRTHLEKRIGEYAKAIIEHAESVAPRIRNGSDNLIQQRLQAIQSTLEIATAGERSQVTAYLNRMTQMLGSFAADVPLSALASEQVPTYGATLNIQSMGPITSMRQETHYEIPENATGYTYERIFRPYIDDATDITIEDPYIRAPHQVHNLARFCALTCRLGEVKKILLKTAKGADERSGEVDSQLDTLARDLKGRGIQFSVERIPYLHDREFRFNNGWVVKIGRGLDIYQKPESWVSVEAEDFSLRRCCCTKVDVFFRPAN